MPKQKTRDVTYYREVQETRETEVPYLVNVTKEQKKEVIKYRQIPKKRQVRKTITEYETQTYKRNVTRYRFETKYQDIEEKYVALEKQTKVRTEQEEVQVPVQSFREQQYTVAVPFEDELTQYYEA